MSADPEQVKVLFEGACDCASEAEVGAYLDRACGGDGELRAEVESLLAAGRAAGEFMARPEVGAGAAAAMLLGGAGGEVGPYRIIGLIGEGGFGSVFRAEQRRPVRREVALKVIKPGMDTREVVARFEAERQAMAIMEHPNVARVFDAGVTAGGRAYFAMELVRGPAVTDFCDAHRLGVRERVRLFVPVCLAVHHAHAKGVIHRDLKPSNVLVAVHDRRPVPKVIDFGIAKAVAGGRLAGQGVVTRAEQFLGTPHYASPEQARGDHAAVGARSDVYALGALLYELLAGAPPFDLRGLSAATPERARQVVCEVEPARPSARVATVETAGARRTSPARLRRALRGELDCVVMKCLEKDPGRRYESAGALAEDLRRCLEGRPITARPASAGYRVYRAIRRRRAAWAVAAVVALAGGIGLAAGLAARRGAAAQRAAEPGPAEPGPAGTGSGADSGSRAATRRVVTTPPRATDLLRLIDPARDAVAGQWRLAGGTLIARGGEEPARLAVRCRPPAEYDFVVEFTVEGGDGPVIQICPTPPGRGFLWQVAWDGYGFEGGRGLPGGKRPLLKRGVTYAGVVRVRAGRIEATLDGVLIAAFDRAGHELGMPASIWRLPETAGVGLGVWNSRVVFSKVELVEVGLP